VSKAIDNLKGRWNSLSCWQKHLLAPAVIVLLVVMGIIWSLFHMFIETPCSIIDDLCDDQRNY